MNFLVLAMRRKDLCQSSLLYTQQLIAKPVAFVSFSNIFLRGRKPGPLDYEKLDIIFFGAANQDVQIDITLSLCAQHRVKRWVGLNINSAPSPVVECSRYRMMSRPRRANVNIKYRGLVFKRTPEHHIFKILRV